MKIVVCVKPTLGGELSPFDGAAYEAALRISGAEVNLLSMAPEKNAELMTRLTRLGAKNAYLLSDKAFAGADTLATGYALASAIKKLSPDLVFCGRQTMEGDTAQVGPGLAARLGYSLITRVMKLEGITEANICCTDRSGAEKTVSYPAVLTFERIFDLRLPSIRSKTGTLTVWSAADIAADTSKCGLAGSPTKVVKSFENNTEGRKCLFVSPDQFDIVIKEALNKPEIPEKEQKTTETPLKNVWVFGEKAVPMAKTVCPEAKLITPTDVDKIAEKVREQDPDAIFFDSSDSLKELAATLAVKLETGLCADCTALETDGHRLFFYRPAFSGNIIAKIVCKTRPAMATVRTSSKSSNIIFAVGAGAVKYKDDIAKLAERYGAELAASRAVVDGGFMKYEYQVGLTGKTVAPKVYVAFGISGAVHHLAGISGAQTVIAVNCDKNAPIFDHADYGIAIDIFHIIK